MADAINGGSHLAHGGRELDGRPISPLIPDELRRIAAKVAAADVDAVAISSVLSPVSAEAEFESRQLLAAELGPEMVFSLSHEFGRIGLLERENATIINASLLGVADAAVGELSASLAGSGITAPLFVTQNDGTLMDLERMRQYPVATFASGPTNSLRGAAALSKLAECIVIDVGGVGTAVGIVSGGFPRQSTENVTLAGIRTSVGMPEILFVPVGGESASAAGIAQVAAAVERLQPSLTPLPIVAVGGAAELLPDRLPRCGPVLRPPHHRVANAVGAAIAPVAGSVDRISRITGGSVEALADMARQEAVDKAIAAGADPQSVKIVDFDTIPMSYLPGETYRIRVKAVGEFTTGAAR